MKKRVIVIVIVALLLLVASVCLIKTYFNNVSDGSYQRHIEAVKSMNQTSTAENDTNYSGLVSGIRTSVYRKDGSLGGREYECTDNGVYFLTLGFSAEYSGYGYDIGTTYLFFADHDSNQMIKLCGRPDCTHDTTECNSSLLHGHHGICYYDGYLYYAESGDIASDIVSLWRVNPDGSDRIKVLDCAGLNNGEYSGFYGPYIQNGVFMIGLVLMDDITGDALPDWYYCRLDDLELKETDVGSCWNDGEAFLHGSAVWAAENVIESWSVVKWDPVTDTETVLATLSGREDMTAMINSGYWGEKNGLCHVDGKILKVNYPNCDTEVLFETGITKSSTVKYYPDCITIYERGNFMEGINGVLHFFDYQGNNLGQVEVDIPVNTDMLPIVGESRDRIYIRGNQDYQLPSHYVDKAEFGTGEIVLHELEYPDLTPEERNLLFSVEVSE